MKKILLLVLLTSVLGFHSFAQQDQWNWYFGGQAAVNFSSGSPVVVAGSAMLSYEGCASISDAFGNLLFYTNGVKVWNRNNIQMPNGFGLYGNIFSSQSAFIAQQPGSSNIYYIFSVDGDIGPNGLCYSIVDMSLDAGLGDVTVKNIQLLTPTSEKLTGVRHCNGNDIWILAHGATNDNNSIDSNFYAYLFSNTGVSLPVISNIGIAYNEPNADGCLQASLNGRKLAVAITDTTQIFDFDNSTGIISNPISIPNPILTTSFGVSFSPDNLKLYIGCTNTIYQYNISSNNQAVINASQYLVDNSINYAATALQLGPDNKLYVATGLNFLNVINSPNILGAGCNFVANAVNLGAGTCYDGLPNMMNAYSVPAPATHVTVDTIYCATTFMLRPTVTGTSYLWSTGATTDSIPITTNGTYWVQVQGASGCNVQVNFMDTFHITFLPPIIVNLGNDTNICTGHSIILNAGNQGNIYHWSTGETTQTITISTSGIYSVTVTDINNGCTGTASQAVTVNPNPAPLILGDVQICQGDTALLDVGAFAQYLWSTGETTEAINVVISNTYFVTVTNGFGCTGTAQQQVRVDTNAIALFTADTLTGCAPLSVTFMNNSSHAIAYLWIFGNGDSSTVSNPTYSYSASGVYTVSLTALGVDGCNNRLVETNYITILSLPVVTSSFTASPMSGCRPLTVAFNNTSVNGITYHWDFGDTSTSSVNSPTHIYDTAGTFTVKLMTTNTSICGVVKDSSTATITVYPQAQASFIADTLVGCSSLMVHFINNSSNASSYLWNFGNTDTSTAMNPSYQYTTSGIYTINLIAYGAGGCNDTMVQSNYITINTLPTVKSAFVADTLSGCNPLTVNFINHSSNGLNYYWNFGDSSTATTMNASHVYHDSGTFAITLIAVNTGPCGTVIDTSIQQTIIRVDEPINVTSSFTAEPVTGCSPLLVNFINNSSNGANYYWSFGDGGFDVIKNPTHLYDTGMFHVYLIAYNNTNRCYNVPDTIGLMITVENCEISIPNVFSPNADGFNDYFQVIAEGYTHYHLLIFNRWGMKVFESTDKAILWNGKLNNTGGTCPNGTYYYIFTATDISNKPYSQKGYLTIIR